MRIRTKYQIDEFDTRVANSRQQDWASLSIASLNFFSSLSAAGLHCRSKVNEIASFGGKIRATCLSDRAASCS